ncbi:MAG: family transporter [Actinomycetia bacterium]|nr:family transporter [Actinomycetes bacterium]MDQ1656069.1 hypothetical protein [Cryptosporangiaceae bacterium]
MVSRKFSALAHNHGETPTSDDPHDGGSSEPAEAYATEADRSEGIVAEAADKAAEQSTEAQPFGRPGRPLNRRSPFYVGMAGAFGVATTYAILTVIASARDALVLIGLAMFIAIGLDPAVSWLVRKGLSRPLAVTVIMGLTLGVAVGFLAAAIPPLVTQTSAFIAHAPQYFQTLLDHNSMLGRLNDRFHLTKRLAEMGTGGGSFSLVNGILGAGMLALSALTSTFVVLVLTLYFLADLPRVKNTLYRLVPHSRRPRVILLGEDICARVGGYVLGNLLTSLIAGFGTFVWLVAFHVPYPLLLALFVAIMDLIPVVGSTVAGIAVSLVALTVSWTVALATVCFYIAYRLAEDYFIVPRVMGRTVEVPAIVTVVSALVGGALLGVIGALVAIPVAAAMRIILREVAFPRLDRS